MQGVGAGAGDDADLCAVALAVGGAVGVRDHVELAHGFNAEQLAAGAAGRDVDERSAGVFNAVEQEEVVLRSAAANGEHVADGRVGGTDTAGALGGVVHGAGVEREQSVVAAAVEGKLLYLVLVDEPRGGLRGGVDGGLGRVDDDLLLHLGDAEDEVDVETLSHSEHDAGLLLRLKALRGDGNRIGTHGHGGREETAIGVSGERACGAGFKLAHGCGSAGDGRAAGVVHSAAQVSADDLGMHCNRAEKKECKEESIELCCKCHVASRGRKMDVNLLLSCGSGMGMWFIPTPDARSAFFEGKAIDNNSRSAWVRRRGAGRVKQAGS